MCAFTNTEIFSFLLMLLSALSLAMKKATADVDVFAVILQSRIIENLHVILLFILCKFTFITVFLNLPDYFI